MKSKRNPSSNWHDLKISFMRWFDADVAVNDLSIQEEHEDEKRVDWIRLIPFIFLHLMCLGVFWIGWSWTAVWIAVALYVIRMFAITGFYHRYFSHKTFKTNRFWQFVFAVLGNSAVQRGPLWWAAHHRHHHRFTDTPKDIHSPSQHGFLWSHMGWLTSKANFHTKKKYVQEWLKYPELAWINRFDKAVPVLLAMILFGGGELLAAYAPELKTDGWQLLIWGFFISSVVLFHATVTINSLDHMVGTRRYNTPDTSRNNAYLALITLGEGWHNNHHHYPISARQGFYGWEIDITYYILKLLSWMGIISELRPVPSAKLEENRIL